MSSAAALFGLFSGPRDFRQRGRRIHSSLPIGSFIGTDSYSPPTKEGVPVFFSAVKVPYFAEKTVSVFRKSLFSVAGSRTRSLLLFAFPLNLLSVFGYLFGSTPW